MGTLGLTAAVRRPGQGGFGDRALSLSLATQSRGETLSCSRLKEARLGPRWILM